MGKRRTPANSLLGDYWQQSQLPLASLFFLLPLIGLYELGTLIYATDRAQGTVRYIYARSLLRDFFEWFGVTGYYLPGLIVVVVLLTWHLAKRAPWRFEPRLYGVMWVESLLLALPLFVFMLALFRQPAPQWMVLARDGGMGQATPWQAQMVFSIGAGIYEELLFRLIAIALLHMVLVDVLALPKEVGAAGAIGLSALAFALYHFSDRNPFDLGKCLFYTGAGIYLAGVYVLRGFGIVAGTHALYDVLVVCLQLAQADRS